MTIDRVDRAVLQFGKIPQEILQKGASSKHQLCVEVSESILPGFRMEAAKEGGPSQFLSAHLPELLEKVAPTDALT